MDQRPDDAAATLDQLRRDRARLNSTTQTPWWVSAGLGLIVALWVVSPALAPVPVSYGIAVVAVVLVLSLARRHTGLRTSARGPRIWALGVLWLLVTLVSYSVSLGLAASNLPAWIVVPSVVSGAATYLCAQTADRWGREGLRP